MLPEETDVPAWVRTVYCDLLKFHLATPKYPYSVDLEVWSKYQAYCVKIGRDFNGDLQRVNSFSHCVTLAHILLPHIISYSETKMLVLVVVECKRVSLIYAYELIFLLHISKVDRVQYSYQTEKSHVENLFL